MFRVELPQRAVNHPQLLTETYHSQLGYWWEGVGYEITQHQAHTLREAMAEMQARLGEAMDHIIANPKILEKFYFTDKQSSLPIPISNKGDDDCADDGTEYSDAFLVAGVEMHNVFEIPDRSKVATSGGDSGVGGACGVGTSPAGLGRGGSQDNAETLSAETRGGRGASVFDL